MSESKTTNQAHAVMVQNLKKSGHDILRELTPEEADVLHMLLGMMGELGELVDALKKPIMYRKTLDRVNLIEELGDLEFYMEGLRQVYNINRDECLEANIKKLLTGKNARYGSGSYSDRQAQDRADKQEVTHTQVDFKREFLGEFPAQPRPKLLILGHAGHGKDGAARVLSALLGLTMKSSSRAAADKVVYPRLQDQYVDAEACFHDRANHRTFWHEAIKEYNTPDKARLAKEILRDSDGYIGMRCKEELTACQEQELFDVMIWVDAGLRKPPESPSSFTVTSGMMAADKNIIIDNNKSKPHFVSQLNMLAREIAAKYGLEVNHCTAIDLIDLLDHEDVAQPAS